MSVYMIDKLSGTSADTLLMLGFTKVLHDVLIELGKPADDIVMEDVGSYWLVSCAVTLNEEDIKKLQQFGVLEPLVTASQRDAVSDVGVGFDYEIHKERRTAYRAQLETLPPAARTPDARLRDDPALQELRERIAEPHPLLPIYAAINQMKIASSFNEPILRWLRLSTDEFQVHIWLLLRLFAQSPNPYEAIMAEWQKLAKEHQLGSATMTMLQVINPTTGKGANKPKADALSIGGVDGFWLLELLKFVGYFTAALPQGIQGSDDRKTYVVRPARLQFTTLERLIRTFRAVVWSSTPMKLDVLAALRLLQVFIQERQNVLLFVDRQQKRRQIVTFTEFVQGLDVTFYKSLGSAVATMNLSFITLPDWLPFPQTIEAAEAAMALLDEHLRILGQLDESRGGEERLISSYRSFLSSRDPELQALFTFCHGYATLLMSRLSKHAYVVYISTANLEVLMNARDQQHEDQKPLLPILKNDGFQNIAAAIRESTITAQYQVSQKSNKRYQIMYGLGQELARALHTRDTFMDELLAFLQRYNAETAREEEKAARDFGRQLTFEARRAYNLRNLVSTDDIEKLTALMDDHGYKIVANMLLAYGYAFDSRITRKQNA